LVMSCAVVALSLCPRNCSTFAATWESAMLGVEIDFLVSMNLVIERERVNVRLEQVECVMRYDYLFTYLLTYLPIIRLDVVSQWRCLAS
jgi:hypothetical protein